MGHYASEMGSHDEWERCLDYKYVQVNVLRESLHNIRRSVGFPNEVENLIKQLEEKIEMIELRYRNKELLKELTNVRKD